MRRAAELVFGSLTSYRYPSGTYNQDQLGLGDLMCQVAGSGEGAFVGPLPLAVIRPMEYSTPFPGIYPWAMQWQNNASGQLDWIFLADNATAAATRRVMMATYNRVTASFSIAGFITVTFPTATVHTIRGLRMSYDKHTAGTVSGTSGTATITGTGTTFAADGACVGNRIGFGSTDPTQITTWYEISAISSDTSITLTTNLASTVTTSAYVIEDLRAIIVTTNATTTNGGLFVVKGLRAEAFSVGGTTVPAATTVDNIRACYWLKDAATITNLIALGMGIQTATSKSSQMVWVLDTTTNPVLFKYNIRAALTLTAGADTTAFVFKTGSGGVLTGTASQANNGRVANTNHAGGSGVDCIYFTTTTRMYRTAALSTITSLSTTWLSGGDVMVEIPPGGVNTIAASSVLNSVEYISVIDKFVIAVNATTTPFHSYVTAYNATSSQIDRTFGTDTRQIDQSTADSSTTPHASTTGGAYSVWCEGGLAYLSTIGTTAITNRVYAVPLAADWEYTSLTNMYVVTPRIACPDIDKFKRAWYSEDEVLGGATGHNLGYVTEAVRMSYRTTGISDDTGSWTLLDSTGDMGGLAGAPYVQFKLEFRTISDRMIPARVLNLGVTYDDLSTDSHYQFSAGKSSAASKQFAWRHSTAFGTTVPTLRVRLYDAVTASLLVDDNTGSPTGTFEKSTNDGGTWGSFNTTDKANDTTYIRYTPSSLADNVKVRAVLTLN